MLGHAGQAARILLQPHRRAAAIESAMVTIKTFFVLPEAAGPPFPSYPA
jgi:hypothetical protein